MNNKVKFLRGTATEYEASTKDNDTFYYTTDDEKLYLGNKEITGGGVTVDDTLSDASEHPVQNKVITNALNTKAILSGSPSATIVPPPSPPSGPRSTIQSAHLITSKLCSMTTTVFPWSTKVCNTSKSFFTSAK